MEVTPTSTSSGGYKHHVHCMKSLSAFSVSPVSPLTPDSSIELGAESKREESRVCMKVKQWLQQVLDSKECAELNFHLVALQSALLDVVGDSHHLDDGIINYAFDQLFHSGIVISRKLYFAMMDSLKRVLVSKESADHSQASMRALSECQCYIGDVAASDGCLTRAEELYSSATLLWPFNAVSNYRLAKLSSDERLKQLLFFIRVGRDVELCAEVPSKDGATEWQLLCAWFEYYLQKLIVARDLEMAAAIRKQLLHTVECVLLRTSPPPSLGFFEMKKLIIPTPAEEMCAPEADTPLSSSSLPKMTPKPKRSSSRKTKKRRLRKKKKGDEFIFNDVVVDGIDEGLRATRAMYLVLCSLYGIWKAPPSTCFSEARKWLLSLLSSLCANVRENMLLLAPICVAVDWLSNNFFALGTDFAAQKFLIEAANVLNFASMSSAQCSFPDAYTSNFCDSIGVSPMAAQQLAADLSSTRVQDSEFVADALKDVKRMEGDYKRKCAPATDGRLPEDLLLAGFCFLQRKWQWTDSLPVAANTDAKYKMFDFTNKELGGDGATALRLAKLEAFVAKVALQPSFCRVLLKPKLNWQCVRRNVALTTDAVKSLGTHSYKRWRKVEGRTGEPSLRYWGGAKAKLKAAKCTRTKRIRRSRNLRRL